MCDEKNCVLLTGTCIYLLTVAYFRFEILNCVQKKKKKDKSQPANCSYFICKSSNDKYFKWLSIWCFASCPSAILTGLLIYEPKLDLILLHTMEVYFYSLFHCFFLSGLIKNHYEHNLFWFFYMFCCCSFSSLQAASVCVTMLCLFPTCIIKYTFKLIGTLPLPASLLYHLTSLS